MRIKKINELLQIYAGFFFLNEVTDALPCMMAL